MGMYTDFQLDVFLKPDTPDDVIVLLNYMLAAKDDTPKPALPDHPLFKCDRWEYFLRGGSACFINAPSTLKHNGYEYELFIRSSFKNYDSEIQHFLDWLAPYCKSSYRDFCGYYLYEENQFPTLIFTPGGIHKEFLFVRLNYELDYTESKSITL